ncbi:MAG: preprotein translocase subunit SecG [Candidatus Komeilibacteria bacterium RIFCSPLOWO2_01_FULL_45_10]|uniref:Protein-export membrane protein SecG n=2 Tax=Parcubacteria group TaxID=1794811 RepID=A0A1G1Y3Q1_9BACT|nr:MAG: preprotein translocase subunit SecG [Candidatus Buchananbacteria bacterium RIFCSPHIGHO2_01_FULL_47_11b]OGY89689.1 MAG: preprotein translocase subunit SecG [Candidatus Komeilibacteria bacterium RIFCSPLOWO2_01_FULL_45_10]
MDKILQIVQLAAAALLVVFILIQQRGAGLGGIFGGESGFYRTKRGAEKVIFILTIVFAIIFIASSLLNVFLGQ